MSTAEIEAMEDQRWSAMIDADLDKLDQLFHPQMTYTHSNAFVEDKASYLNSIETKRFDYRSAERSDTKIVVEGPTAVVTGRAEIQVVAGGREVALSLRYTAVWVHVDGTWRFIAWGSTSIPA
jgi:ketosteroid isomerase-like protein